ncbi:MAG: hypothetical protein ABJD68_06080 [Nakamurella sp.]
MPDCERKVFTEDFSRDARAGRITTRARLKAAQSNGDHGWPASSVADELGMDWRMTQDAFVA